MLNIPGQLNSFTHLRALLGLHGRVFFWSTFTFELKTIRTSRRPRVLHVLCGWYQESLLQAGVPRSFKRYMVGSRRRRPWDGWSIAEDATLSSRGS
jgi:hypothetical protein